MQSVKDISRSLCDRVCKDPKWLFLFFAISQAHLIAYLFSSYLVLWLASFVSTGEIEDSEGVEVIFSRMTLVSIPGTIITILVAGILSDYVKPVYMIAPAFLLRAITCYQFKNVEDPKNPGAYALTSLMIVFSIIAVISLESLL